MSGGSVFGGGGNSFAQPANGNAFGSPSAFGGVQSVNNSFGNTNSGGMKNTSGFGGGGAQAQGGFGSPTQQTSFQTTAPAFGQTPSFGGAATFGSPKGGFGTFANSSFQSNNIQQGNSLFESLGGSQATGMTFGNLAQGAQIAAPPQPFAPQGGSGSFSTWR